MLIFKYVDNSSVDEEISGAWNFPGRPEYFQAGLELNEVAGPAGLYLMKIKVGHCPGFSIVKGLDMVELYFEEK